MFLLRTLLNIELIKQEEEIMDTTSVNVLQKTMEYQNSALERKLGRVESDLAYKIDQNNHLLEQIKSKIAMTWIFIIGKILSH